MNRNKDFFAILILDFESLVIHELFLPLFTGNIQLHLAIVNTPCMAIFIFTQIIIISNENIIAQKTCRITGVGYQRLFL